MMVAADTVAVVVAAGIRRDRGRCTRQHARSAVRKQKCRSSRAATAPCTAAIASSSARRAAAVAGTAAVVVAVAAVAVAGTAVVVAAAAVAIGTRVHCSQ
jgi:hypothetical protein